MEPFSFMPAPKTNKVDIKRLSRGELASWVASNQWPRFRSTQLLQWLYQKGVAEFDEMTNLSKELRVALDELAWIRKSNVVQTQVSKDGTIKFLFSLFDKQQVEAVLIPEFFDDGVADRLTVCVSSQVGCLFGCSFCATGKMGFIRHLTHGEIVDQLVKVNECALEKYGKRITNIVYMGMGEPLHNYHAVVESAAIVCSKESIGLSPKRITVSTVGLADRIKQLSDFELPLNLAVSLHAADDEKRNQIMPINERMKLSDLKESVQYYYRQTGQSLTYEYLLFHNFNDGALDAKNLAQVVAWVPSKVNIIMYNDVSGVELKRASEQSLDAFMKALSKFNVRATVRRSRGDDIDAGCGQLAIRDRKTQGKTLSRRE